MLKVELVNVRKGDGMAGRVELVARVQYEGEPARNISFVGSLVGGPGPVYMISPDFAEPIYVHSPERFGDVFDRQWVERFYA